jgi:hypothetical protein
MLKLPLGMGVRRIFELKRGGGIMEPNLNVSVYDPEIDMNRRLGRTPAGLVKRLFTSLHRLRTGDYDFGKPRRSIDRKQQEYSPLCEM